jgi:hypothetical protein
MKLVYAEPPRVLYHRYENFDHVISVSATNPLVNRRVHVRPKRWSAAVPHPNSGVIDPAFRPLVPVEDIQDLHCLNALLPQTA